MKVAPTSEVEILPPITTPAAFVDNAFQRPFPKLGITMKGIQDFISLVGSDKLEGLTTTEVSPMIQNLTKEKQCSYCDSLIDTKVVRKANIFVSHAWKYKFLSVVSALENHYKHMSAEGQDSIVFWFDLFSNSQHGLDSGTPPPFSWWCSTFMTAIKNIGTVVMVLEPWSNPITLTRVWCLWEVYCASATGSKFEIAMSASETATYRKQIVEDTGGFITMLSNIDVRNSEAFNPLDKQQIFEVINKKVGFPKLNSMVLKTVRQWALNNLQQYIEHLQSHIQEEGNAAQLADVYAALGEIGSSALRVFGKGNTVKKWWKEAYKRQCEVHGETHDKTLRSLRNLAKLDINFYIKGCKQVLERYGPLSFYFWDVRLSRQNPKLIDDFNKVFLLLEVDADNAAIAADLYYKVIRLKPYTRMDMQVIIGSLSSYLPPNNVLMVKLELLLISASKPPSKDDFVAFRRCTSRLNETLGYGHQDVKKAYGTAMETAFDYHHNDYFLEFACQHCWSGVVLFDFYAIMHDGCLMSCLPCNNYRESHGRQCRGCEDNVFRTLCVDCPFNCFCGLPVLLLNLIPVIVCCGNLG